MSVITDIIGRKRDFTTFSIRESSIKPSIVYKEETSIDKSVSTLGKKKL